MSNVRNEIKAQIVRAGFTMQDVVDKLAEMGYKNLTLAASSLASVHAPLVRHIKNGVITHIETSGLRGELAEEISRGLMDCPVVFRSHGGRASAIRSGDLHIDVAFLGAPSCDPYGNANGYSRDGEDGIACGSLGYARPDATYADNVIVITNHLVAYPNAPWAIPEFEVDYVVMTDDIGDPKGIMSGATRYTKDPKELLIAKTAANVIEAAGYLYDGFSMQMGSGGASLATARFLRQKMIDQNIHCRFALGGITGQIAAMHEEGLIDRILDVQSFDLDAAKSLKNNHFHHQIGASYYASHLVAAAVDQLDFVILSALEIDTDFNVNVLTGSDGVIRGAIGGHPDTAEGASLSVVVAPLTRGRIPTIVKRVNTVVTPGDVVDVVVTDQGIAVNPRRPDVKEKLEKAGLHVFTIQQLQQRVQAHKACQRDAEGGQKSDDERARHGLLEQVLVLGPVGARCNDGKAVADADAKAHQKLVDRAAGANGGKGGIAQHIAHDHGVHRVVELLEQVRDEDGQHEDDQALENGAVHQVYVHRKWGSFCGLGHAVPPIRPENDPLRLGQRGPF